MTQKVYKITAIIASLFFGMLAMGGHVNASTVNIGEWCKHYDWTDMTVCGHFQGYSWTHVGSHLVLVDSGQCPCGDAPGAGYACNNCNSFTQHPTIQQASFRTDDCFWSFPVKCYPS